MVLDLVIIGLAITLEPVTLVAFSLILRAERGVMKGLAFILGWTACLVVVIAAVLLLTGGKPPRPNTAPSVAALAIRALLGAVLIWVGLRQRRRMGRPRKQPGWMATAGSSVAVGRSWAWRIPPAVVTRGRGAATIVQAKLSTAGDWLTLVLFCLLATSGFLVMELYATFAPEAAAVRLKRCRPGSARTRTRRSSRCHWWWGPGCSGRASC